MAGKSKIVKGALEAIGDVASFSSAKQKKDFGALPEDIKYGSALSLQKPLITKGRNIHELAADIVSRGFGRSEGGLAVNTPNEKEVLKLVLDQMDLTSEYGKGLKSLDPDKTLSRSDWSAAYDAWHKEAGSDLIKRIRAKTEEIGAFDESDKIIDKDLDF